MPLPMCIFVLCTILSAWGENGATGEDAFFPGNESGRVYTQQVSSQNFPANSLPAQPIQQSVVGQQQPTTTSINTVTFSPHSEIESPFVRITGGMVKIFEKLDPQAPVLGIAQKGSYYPLIIAGDSWCKIEFNGKAGWVERRYVVFTDKVSSPFLRQSVLVIILLGILLAIGLIIKLVMNQVHRMNNVSIETKPIEKHALIIAREDKYVQRYLSGASTLVENCFAEIGFCIHRAHDLPSSRKIILQQIPDIIVMDWEIVPDSPSSLQRLLLSNAAGCVIPTIFYNVPDAATMQQDSRSPATGHYLGHSFTDRELFSIVTPLLITGAAPRADSNNSEPSALEGRVGDGSLLEVFQFVEIGRKNGCLLVEKKKPYGIVFFKDGSIIHAASERASGQAAIFDILNLREGKFRFVLDKAPKTTNCAIPTLSVLMEWSKAVDEAHGS